jgi:GNAT superfamily N-acetyltransferase
MVDEIRIEQMTLADKPAVLEFLKKAYPDNLRHCDPVYWDWHFANSPYIDKDELPIWLARDGDRIAGQLATLPVQLNISGRTERALWVLDWIVDADYRRRGIGKKLAMAAEAFSPYLLGVNTERQHSPALLLGQNWVIVTKIPRFHKILFPGEAFPELSKNRAVRRTFNTAFSPLRRLRGQKLKENADIRLLSNFKDSFDDLWDRARSQWNCLTTRNARVLAWQFTEQPYKHFDIIGYFENGRLLGYAVLFFRKANKYDAVTKAAISDILYAPEAPQRTVDALINASLKMCIERKAGGLVTDAIDPLLRERYRRFGFWKVNSPLLLMAKAPQNKDIVYSVDSWFLTRGDSDISIFEHSNLEVSIDQE